MGLDLRAKRARGVWGAELAEPPARERSGFAGRESEISGVSRAISSSERSERSERVRTT